MTRTNHDMFSKESDKAFEAIRLSPISPGAQDSPLMYFYHKIGFYAGKGPIPPP